MSIDFIFIQITLSENLFIDILTRLEHVTLFSLITAYILD